MKTLSAIKEYFTPSEIISPRTNNFNIIRVFAAFMVIYGHMGTIMGTSVFALLGCAVSTLGVKILFTVSGYLITKSFLSDSHFGRYMIRRSFRIYPALFVLILFSGLVAGPLLTTPPPAEYLRHPARGHTFGEICCFIPSTPCPAYLPTVLIPMPSTVPFGPFPLSLPCT